MGRTVVLTCTYDVQSYGNLAICWNRGQIPYSGCDKQLVATDGFKVNTDSVGSRFQLLGRLDQGDVSLTIMNLTEDDAGLYGCRVDVPGWFNDDKHHTELTVNRGKTELS